MVNSIKRKIIFDAAVVQNPLLTTTISAHNIRIHFKNRHAPREGEIMSEIQALAGAEKTDAGVQVNGAVLQPIVEKCEGCDRIRAFEGENYCSVFPVPAAKWRMGARCSMATHIQVARSAAQKVNPLKAAKRASKSKK